MPKSRLDQKRSSRSWATRGEFLPQRLSLSFHGLPCVCPLSMISTFYSENLSRVRNPSGLDQLSLPSKQRRPSTMPGSTSCFRANSEIAFVEKSSPLMNCPYSVDG